MAARGLSVEGINQRLVAAGLRVRVIQRGNALYLQSTLPPKAGEARPKQRQLALKVPATVDGLRVAEAKAFELASQLTLGTFQWSDWERVAQNRLRVGDAIAQFKTQYQSTHALSDGAWHHFWWVPAFSKLPQDAELSAAIALATVNLIPQNTWTRRQACMQIQKLCDWAGIAVDLGPYRGKPKPKDINPPTQQEIEDCYGLISSPKWRRIYARIAIFGLRPHEAFYFERTGPLEGRVTEGKTGARDVLAVWPHLLEQWEIDGELPKLTWKTYKQLGSKISIRYNTYKIPYSPYDFRHAAAIEFSVVRGAPLKLAALQFGHSEEIHLKTYTKWLNKANLRQAYDRIMKN